MNGLDFPLPNGPAPPKSISTDLHSWDMTLDMPWCKRTDIFPSPITRWGLAATSGAHHLWHLDCDGFGTYVDVKVGAKLWIVARPKDNESFEAFASTRLFIDGYDMAKPGSDRWILEAVLLEPGTRL